MTHTKQKKVNRTEGYILMEDGSRLYLADSKPGQPVQCPECKIVLIVGREQYREGWDCPCGAKLIGKNAIQDMALAKLADRFR